MILYQYSFLHAQLHHFEFDQITDSVAGDSISITIYARDQFGQTVTDFTGSCQLSDSTNTISPVTTGAFSAGVWSGNVVITQAFQNDVIRATYLIIITGDSNPFDVTAGPLDHFDFSTITSPQMAGISFVDTIVARDEFDNRVTNFNGDVALSDVTNSLTPTLVTFSAGWWYGSMTITEAVNEDSITASYNDVIGVSNTFAVDNGPHDHFEFTPVGSPQTAGVPFPVSIAAMDEFGNLVDDFAEIVSLSDLTGTLSPESVNFSAGWWSGQLTVTEAVSVDSVTAAYNGKTGSSDAFSVENNSLDHFVFSNIPSPQRAGDPFSMTIGAADAYGNLVDEFNGTAILSDITGTLNPNSATFSGGLWSSSSVTITQSIDADSIVATYDTVSTGSNIFEVNSNDLDRFEFANIGTQTAGQAFEITIYAKDQYGNIVESFTDSVQLSDLTNTIDPDTTGQFTNGVWTGDVTISIVYDNDKITAFGSFRTGESNTFNVVAAQVDHFEFAQISGNKTAGEPFPITIYAKDSLGNTVDTYEGRAFLSDVTGTINPTETENFQNGVWSGNVSITQSALNDWITAEDTANNIQGTSNQFNVLPADLDHFVIDPISNQTAGVNFVINITAYDQYGNVKLGFQDAVSLTDSSGTIYPTTTGNFVNGEISQSVRVTMALDGEWIRATYNSITGISNSFNVSPGSLDHFIIDAINDQVAGTPFSITVTAYDAWGNLKTDFADTVSLNDLTGTIEPDTTGQFTSGFWQGEVTISSSITNDRITASYSNKTGVSNYFDVIPAELDHFEFSQISAQTAGIPFHVDVTAMDSLDNVVTYFNQDVELYDLSGSLSDTIIMSGGIWSGDVLVTTALDNDLIVARYTDIMSFSNSFTVSPANPKYLTLDPPDPISITVGTSQVFSATVTDSFLNPVSLRPVTFIIKGFRDGALDDNPDDPNDTSGNPWSQSGTTDDNGVLTVLYVAPEMAGLVDTLDAYSPPYIGQDDVDDVTITSVDSGATKLVIKPEDPQQIRESAGEIFTIIVEAQDGFGNVDVDDTTMVGISTANGNMEFSKDDFLTTLTEFQLSEGSDTLQVRSCAVADYDTITVEDIDVEGIILAPYKKSQVYIEPNVPADTIYLQASKDTLTANGVDSTLIQSGAIVDSCGNTVVQGTFVTVATNHGIITTQDQDPGGTPGIQVKTDQDGSITFTLRASTSPDTSTVTATSVEGSAVGSIDIIFQSPPSLTYLSGSLVPNTVSPGDSVSFHLLVKNDGNSGVTLSTSSIFQFSDGINVYSSNLMTPVELIGGSDWDTLIFESEKVPEEMQITSYTPLIILSGMDFNENDYNQVLTLDPNSLQISTMSILMVQSPADTVTIEDSLGITLAIENSGEQSITIEDYGLLFNPTGHFAQFTEIPVTLPAGVTSYLVVGVKVNSLTPTGKYYIDGFASGSAGGSEIGDNSADLIDSLIVISLATAEYVEGSLEPVTVSPGGTYSFSIRVRNEGESSVNLNTQYTKITLHGEGFQYEAFLENETTMTGGGAATRLIFEQMELDSNLVSGEYPISVFLSGRTLLGADFSQNLAEIDTVEVQSKPELQYIDGSIFQERISKGYTVKPSLRVSNLGEATLDLSPEKTVLYMSDGQNDFEASLDQDEVTVVASGDTTLTFEMIQFPFDFGSGEFTPLLILDGEYNQMALIDTLALDAILVQEPATIAVNAQRSDTIVTIGQSFIVEAVMENKGEAGIMDEGTLILDLSGTDFSVNDPIKQFGPELPDTIFWNVTVPDTSNEGIFDIEIEVQDIPHDENTNPPQLALLYQGGRDIISVSVVEGNELMISEVEMAGFPPRNVYAGQSTIPMMALELSNRGNAKNEIRLDSMKVSVRERDGNTISPASVSIEGLFVATDQEGTTVLTTASDLSGDKILLELTPHDYRIGADPDSLYFFIDLRDSPATETVLLHFDGDEDVYATDLSNGKAVAVVDALGSPLPELISDFIVLSADDFKTSFKNYPNPFRAGSEATTFSYFLPENAEVDMSIYTLTGELVKKFHLDAGSSGGSGSTINTFQWDGRNGSGKVVQNGVYICIVTARLESDRILSLKHKAAVMK